MCQVPSGLSVKTSPLQALCWSSQGTAFLMPHTLSFSMTHRNTDFSFLLGLLPILMKTVTPFEWSCRLK